MNLLWQTQQSVVIHLFTERCFSWTLKPLELGTWRVPFIAWTSEGFEKQKRGNFSKKKNGGGGGGFLRNPKKNGRIMFTDKTTPLATSIFSPPILQIHFFFTWTLYTFGWDLRWWPKRPVRSSCALCPVLLLCTLVGGSKFSLWQGSVKLVFYTWEKECPNQSK